MSEPIGPDMFSYTRTNRIAKACKQAALDVLFSTTSGVILGCGFAYLKEGSFPAYSIHYGILGFAVGVILGGNRALRAICTTSMAKSDL